MPASKSPTRSRQRPSGSSNGSEPHANSQGDASNAKQVAGVAKGPGMVLGAVGLGLAGLALKRRRRRTKVLGLSLPNSSDLDMKSLAKTAGQASKKVAKTSKKVARKVERVGGRAGPIAKVLD